ncbi:hypothetical protein [Algoriphagus sp.]|uniref:hypothetical protein n=1 Tax=Algoriphagus sp. TaxID=1872435 RepID=UPI002620FE3B|nr:hypothetical protein [Algoriphagus sp.]
MNNFIIPLQQAEGLVENFQVNIPKEDPVVQFGGIIDVESLPYIKNPPLIYKGFMAWFGLNQRDELVLFFEDDVYYDPNNLPTKPSKSSLLESDRIINKGYLGTSPNRRIQDLSVPSMVLGRKDKFTPNSQVISAINRFKNLFPLDSNRKPFNNYPFGFFENNTIVDFSIFLNQPNLKHIAYFFGYNDLNPEYIATNRIRIVLAGLSDKGVLLPSYNEANMEDRVLLQYSWPPPPNS